MCLAHPLPSMFEDDTDRFTVLYDKQRCGLNDTLQIPAVQLDAEMLNDLAWIHADSALKIEE